MNKSASTTLTLCLLISTHLVGCGDSKSNGTAASAGDSGASAATPSIAPTAPTSPDVTSPQSSPPVAKADSAVVSDPNAAPAMNGPGTIAMPAKTEMVFDMSFPLDKHERFHPINRDGKLTYTYFAFTSDPIDENEKLNMLSPKYYNEKDAFKKKEMEDVERQLIEAELQRIRSQRYFSFLIASESTDDRDTAMKGSYGFVSWKPYNFDTQSFEISSADMCTGSGTIRMPQGIRLTYVGSDSLCNVTVTDLDTAKAIESARAANRLHIGGSLYFSPVKATNGELFIKVLHAEYRFFEGPTTDSRDKKLLYTATVTNDSP